MAASTRLVDPPSTHSPVTLTDASKRQQFSRPWADFYQELSDMVNDLAAGRVRGVTDGSEVDAGYVGERMAAAGAATVSLTSATVANIAQLDLTPGDWEVSGLAVFLPTHAPYPTRIAAGISDDATALGPARLDISADGFAADAATQVSAGLPRRFNVTVATTVYLTVLADFGGSGAVLADGVIAARRMR